MNCIQILNENLFKIIEHSEVKNVDSMIYEMMNM